MNSYASDQTVTLINSPDLQKPSGFSHAATADGMTFWFSGQISSDVAGAIIGPGNMASQFGQALQNLATALKSATCKPQDVVKLTYFVTDVAAYKKAAKQLGEPYSKVFGHHFPPATLVEVKGLIDPEAMVEIECIAVRRPVP
jgi:enamine deaminase RidA (YjgF/YER057c/UK114 family)